MKEKPPNIVNRDNWLKVGVVVLFSCLAAYMIVTGQIHIEPSSFSFGEFLTLILSIFAIAMSVAFYFKATETSNQFYDNTYKFTKDISEILGRIEAGFGERLRHLDEGYSGLSARFDKMPIDTAKAQEEVKKEEERIARKEKERERLIEDLAKRAKLQEGEKIKLFQDLKRREEDLREAQRELMYFRHRAKRAEEEEEEEEEAHGKEGQTRLAKLPTNITNYIRRRVIPELGGFSDVLNLPSIIIEKRFNSIRNDFPVKFIDDCMKYDIIQPDGNLNRSGALIIKSIARREIMTKTIPEKDKAIE